MLESMKLPIYESLRPMLPLPQWQKLVFLLTVFTLVMSSYFYLGWIPLQDAITQQESQLQLQRAVLFKNLRMAHDLARKQKEYVRLGKELKVALNMLPKKSQIPDLLESVSRAGKDSGLEFRMFKPDQEVVRQIYAEVPVTFNIDGSFLQLLTFLKRVGEMPRIVDVKNLVLTKGKTDNILSISGQAVTYRFVDGASAQTRKGRRQ